MHDVLPFDRIAARGADVPAGWRGAAPLSCGALLERARQWQGLAERGAVRQVALHLDDALDFAAALLGAWEAGVTVWLAADALPATRTALAGQVDAFWGGFAGGLSPGDHDRGRLAAQRLGRASTALVVFTSGSSGAPQAIPKTLAQLLDEAAALERAFGQGLAGAAILSTVSHQHIYGLLFKVLWPLMAGRPIVSEALVYPEQLAAALALRPCVLVSSPAHLGRLPAHVGWGAAAAQLREVFSSGGPLSAAAAQESQSLLGRIPCEVYGSSETGGIAWRRQLNDPSWTPLPGVAWRASAEGLLQVCSPHTGDAWLALADRVEAAGAGFRLQGRADRIVKVEEKRVSLDAVEAALRGSGLLAEVRVLALAGEEGRRGGLAVAAVPNPEGASVLAQNGKLALNRRLRAHLAGVVETVALPRRWRYVDAFPANAQGKVALAGLEQLFAPRPKDADRAILEQTEGRVLVALSVPADLAYFDGHFDVMPVLPGVVQVDWAIRLGRRHFALPPHFRTLAALKFQHIVRPGQPVQLELAYDPAKASLAFRYFSAAGQHASGRILFDPL